MNSQEQAAVSTDTETVEFQYSDRTYRITGEAGEYLLEKIRETGTFYELDLLEEISEILPGGHQTAIDVGANLGNHTLYLAGHLGLDVIAIEPERFNVDLLRENISANGLSDKVDVLPYAAMASRGSVQLRQNIQGNRGTFTAHVSSEGIEAIVLDEIQRDRGIGLIKIDVEGAELEVLEGARRLIKDHNPIIVIEAHTSDDRRSISQFFASMQYEPAAIAGISDNYFWMPIKAGRDAKDAVWSRGVIEGLRKEHRFSKAVLDEVSNARREIHEISANVTRDESDMTELLSLMQGEQSNSGIADRSGRFLTAEEAFQLKGEIREHLAAVERLRRSLAEDSASHANLIGTHSRGINANIDDMRAVLRPINALLERTLESNALDGEVRSLVRDAEARIESLLEAKSERGQEALEALSAKLLSAVQHGDARSEEALSQTRALRDLIDERLQPSNQLDKSRSVDNASEPDERLIVAYAKLAHRLERADPRAWSAKTLIDSLISQLDISTELSTRLSLHDRKEGRFTGDPQRALAEMRELPRNSDGKLPMRDRVRVGIASMKGREQGLRRVIEIIAPQADEVFVYLNDMNEIPAILPRKSNVKFFTGPDVGDRGKFAFLNGFTGYYITCDDDIEYAPFHIHSIVDGIEKYSRTSVVGWHGSIFKDKFSTFYDSNSRQVLSFRFLRGLDTPVHLLGTGVCGFHTDTLQIRFEEFLHANMADVFLAIAAKNQKVPMVVLAHGKDWAKPLDVGPSISSVSLKKDEAPKGGLDVAKTVSDLVLKNRPWSILKPEANYERKTFSVAFVGRTDRVRWRKGGILKSAHLTVDQLRRFGVDVLLEDIVTGDPQGLHGRAADIVMLYVGDPERPDFRQIEKLVQHHATAGRKIIINLSYNGKASRAKFIVDKITYWSNKYPNAVYLMVFTEAALSAELLSKIRNQAVLVPKTLVFPDEPVASFRQSEGVFVGDIAKLSDDSLLDYPASEWLASIRRALPGTKIYGVRQYEPKYHVNLDIDEVWPFLADVDFVDKIARRRLMVSLVKYATFEMVPVESAGLGVPVIYPEMPQSLSEHLGLSGVRVDSPDELERVLPVIYRDPLVWRSLSESGISRARSSELNNSAGQLYVRLLGLL